MKKFKNLSILFLCLTLCACSSTDAISDEIENIDEEVNEIVEDIETTLDITALGTGESYTNSEDGEHTIISDGTNDTYDNIYVYKTGESSGDEADFYGLNAAVFATNSATLNITNSKIETDGSHANGVFSYGEGTIVNISNSYIHTSSNNSGGIMTTGGGTMNATNLIIETLGGSSAAIRSDRGGGTVNVDGGKYSSYGKGSPAIYSTADITVSNAKLYSDISQAVVVEGGNSVTLNNVEATGQNTYKNSDNSNYYQAVMIYQSMSGDASSGTSSFTMTDGSLTSLNGGMFFVTNTIATINLENVTLNYASDDLLRICAAGWGSDGSNGGQVTMNNKNQSLKGIVTVDSISTLNLYLDNSNFEGCISNDGEVYVELSNGATWTLTGDTSITSLTCDSNSINLNGFTLTVNGQIYNEGTTSSGSAVEVKTSSSSNHGGSKPNGTPPEKK